jgi:CoA:oxalate CoA-transferase
MASVKTPDGEPREEARPLAGVTVLDITRVVAGPFCSMLLADLGATVIKVEHPDDPDYARSFPPMVGGDEGAEESAFFSQFNRNKLGITVNLKSPDGKELLKQLVRRADVLVENFRPGTMEKLGLGYEELRRCNPRLIYTAISGFGRSGPNSSRPAFDNTGQAVGGLWSMNGYPDRPPVRVGTIIGDLAASLYATIGTLAALRAAERTGNGQVVDVSQQDSILTLTENAVVRYTTKGETASPLGNDHPFVRPYGQFPCKDGYVFFGGYTDKFWRLTCEIFGEPHQADDPEIDTMEKRFDPKVAERKVKPLLERWFSAYGKAELEAMAGDRIPLSAIRTVPEVVEDPHVAARNMIVEIPVAGESVRMFGSPIKLSRTGEIPLGKAPSPGEHTRAILSEFLKLDEAGIQRLVDSGAV